MANMVVARVNIPDELDRFIGNVKDMKGFNSKNEALNFIIKEYEKINGTGSNNAVNEEEKPVKQRKVKEQIKKQGKPRKLQQNHISEIKSLINEE